MSNSPLATKYIPSPNNSGPRKMPIDRITPHCVVGQATAESICNGFKPRARKASCNYAIGFNGDIALCVDESKRSWCSSSNANDQRAVTIECASDTIHPYKMTDAVWQSLITLCADICKRNWKKKLLWFPDKDTALSYNPKPDEMVLTVHRWFAAKECPGDWLYYRLAGLASVVTASLDTSAESRYYTYMVKKGDTLWGIASRELGKGQKYMDIMKLNQMTSITIRPGDMIKIPK